VCGGFTAERRAGRKYRSSAIRSMIVVPLTRVTDERVVCCNWVACSGQFSSVSVQCFEQTVTCRHAHAAANVQITLDGPVQTLSLVGSGRRLFRSVSTCTDFVHGSGLVGSQTKSVAPCSGI